MTKFAYGINFCANVGCEEIEKKWNLNKTECMEGEIF
jgi:hypothetical protein